MFEEWYYIVDTSLEVKICPLKSNKNIFFFLILSLVCSLYELLRVHKLCQHIFLFLAPFLAMTSFILSPLFLPEHKKNLKLIRVSKSEHPAQLLMDITLALLPQMTNCRGAAAHRVCLAFQIRCVLKSINGGHGGMRYHLQVQSGAPVKTGAGLRGEALSL